MAGIQPSSGVGPSQSQNTLADPNIAPGCANLWYAPRCNPRLDPFAMNAVIAEILNLVNCGGTEYDCARLDNMCTAVKDLIEDTLHGCMQRVFPTAAGACAIETLVLVTDNTGCKRIARFAADSNLLATAVDSSVWGTAFPSTLRPLTPATPATFYTFDDLYNDVLANTVNPAKLTPNHLVHLLLNLPCETRVRLQVNASINFNPAAVGGVGQQSKIVLSVDNVFRTNPGTLADYTPPFTNFEASVQQDIVMTLPAGPHVIDSYIVAHSSAKQPAQVNVVGQLVGGFNSIYAFVDRS